MEKEKAPAAGEFADLPFLALGSLLAQSKEPSARRERTAEERNADRAAMLDALAQLYEEEDASENPKK